MKKFSLVILFFSFIINSIYAQYNIEVEEVNLGTTFASNKVFDEKVSKDGLRYTRLFNTKISQDYVSTWFSVNGKHWGIESGDLKHITSGVISPDGFKYAVIGNDGDSSFLVTSGLKQLNDSTFEIVSGKKELKCYGEPRYAKYSPDSKHLAYRILVSKDKFAMVRDGKCGKLYDVVGEPVWSSNSLHLAYIAKLGDKSVTIVDGIIRQTTATYPDWLTISEDGKHVAYLTGDDSGFHVVTDNLVGANYKGLSNSVGIVYSSDGNKVAYVAITNSNKQSLIVNNKVIATYDGIFKVGFSQNGLSIAFLAYNDGKFFSVVDGKEGYKYDQTAGDFSLSNDGKHIAHGAVKGKETIMVVDGQESEAYEIIPKAKPVFSPDNKFVVYPAIKNGKKMLFVFGIPDGVYTYEGIIDFNRIIFDTPTTFHTLVTNGKEIILLKCRINFN